MRLKRFVRRVELRLTPQLIDAITKILRADRAILFTVVLDLTHHDGADVEHGIDKVIEETSHTAVG